MNHYVFLPSELKFNEGNLPERVQLFRTGTFYDDRYGQIDISEKTLSTIKRNFDAKIRGVDIAIDFAHDSSGIAAGWIRGLELANGELWGVVEWTESGKKSLQAKEYRYLSPDFTFNYQDNETLAEHGCLLLGAGLTNRPVIKNMAPAVQLRELTVEEKNKVTELDETKKQLAELQVKYDELFKSKEEKPMEKDQEMKELSEAKAKMAEMQKEIDANKEKLALAEKNSSFDKMLSEGKTVEAQRDAFLKGDMVTFAEKAQAIKLTENGSETKTETSDDKDAQEQVIELAAKMSKEQSISMSEATKKVLTQNKDLRLAYEKAVQI